MVNCLQSFIVNIVLYKASIYNKNSAYSPFALARFNGKVLQDINIKLSFLISMRYSKKLELSKEVGNKFLYSSDVQARDNILYNEFPCQRELAEVSCIDTIVPVKQQI